MASNRVSLKGRGADIFFGDDSPVSTVPPLSPEPDDPKLTLAPIDHASPASTPTPPPMVVQASMQESKRARLPARQPAAPEEGKSLSLLPLDLVDAVWDDVTAPATITNSFRYTEQELTWLSDAIYEVTRRHRVRLTKQDVARLGLQVILHDYRLHGDASLLGELVRRKGRQRNTRD